MSYRESDFAFPLYCILHIFLDDVFFGFSINYSLDLKNAWAVRVLNSALYEVPHPFTLLLINGLFDVPYVLVLLFGLCVYEAILKVHFSQPFSLLSELRFFEFGST